MRKIFATLSMLLVAAFGLASAQDQPKKPQDLPAQKYAALLDRAKKSDATLDFKELRMAYTETADYSPYGGDRETRKQMFAPLNAKELEPPMAAAAQILA